MSANDTSPLSPSEDSHNTSKDDDRAIFSVESVTTSLSKETPFVKGNSDEIGVELDYEEEICGEGEREKESSEDLPQKNDIVVCSDSTKDKLHAEEDEGEISGEEDDLEEGELKETSSQSPSQGPSHQICRFFTRGQCYYGTACRFLHLTNESGKGHYNMFSRYTHPNDGYYGAALNTMIADRSGPRTGIDYIGALPVPPMPVEQSVTSAWERGLREAKELVKRANKRKEEEPDFHNKKNYISINFNEKNTLENDKENDYMHSETPPPYKHHLRGGPPPPRYDNFEIQYSQSREEMPQRMNFHRRNRDRSRGRLSPERDRLRYASKERERERNKAKDDRAMFHVQMTRAFEYVDPWRRSKTPKARRGGRSRSGSYSSVSSSYSDRSSRSNSYSRSSSRSSCASSRTPSIKRKSPAPDTGSNRFSRKKPYIPRSPSFSSRSRSASSAPSRSYSRSISMDSVSSDSSCVSHSSCDSLRNREHPIPEKKSSGKLPLELLDVHRQAIARGELKPYEIYPSEREAIPSVFPSFQHLIPDDDTKSVLPNKQPIKLTLLNKPTTSKTSFPKKELDRTKLMLDGRSDSSKQDTPNYATTSKRPLSPTLSALHQKPEPFSSKKSTSSRRDELLKQLKAVEDAIARKRAKLC